MALHSVDKDGNTRGNPSPNTHDTTEDTVRMAHQTFSTTLAAQGTVQTTRIVHRNNVILYYDDQGRIIGVDGFIPSLAAYPVKIIAKYGYDVYTDILGISPPS